MSPYILLGAAALVVALLGFTHVWSADRPSKWGHAALWGGLLFVVVFFCLWIARAMEVAP